MAQASGEQASKGARLPDSPDAQRRLFCTWYQAIPRGYSGSPVRGEGEAKFGGLQPALGHYRALDGAQAVGAAGALGETSVRRAPWGLGWAFSRGLHRALSADAGATHCEGAECKGWIPWCFPSSVTIPLMFKYLGLPWTSTGAATCYRAVQHYGARQ